jgi:hypothetical protein
MFAVLLLITTARYLIVHALHQSPPSAAMETLAQFLFSWHMPLFFLISGSATWFSLGLRTRGDYFAERIKRLVIPLIFGTFVIIPIMIYCQRLYYHEFSGSYIHFYPHFFDGIYPHGNFSWGNLWFLAYLFVFSLVALPIFLFLRNEIGQRLVSRVGAFCERPGAIFLLAIPLAVIEAALRAKWPSIPNLYRDWANFFWFLTFYIYGYLLCSDESFGRSIDKHGEIALLLGVVSVSTIFGFRWTGSVPQRDYTLGWMSYMVLYAFNSWFWIVAILSLGRRYLNFNHPRLPYANEAGLPFYVLHHAAIVVIACYVVRWNLTVGGKFFIICIASFVATLGLYDLAVRRASFTRFHWNEARENHRPHTYWKADGKKWAPDADKR